MGRWDDMLSNVPICTAIPSYRPTICKHCKSFTTTNPQTTRLTINLGGGNHSFLTFCVFWQKTSLFGDNDDEYDSRGTLT